MPANHKWTEEQRIVLHILHTQTTDQTRITCIFNEVFRGELTQDVREGALKSQYRNRNRNDDNIAKWVPALRQPNTAEDTTTRQKLIQRISEATAAIDPSGEAMQKQWRGYDLIDDEEYEGLCQSRKEKGFEGGIPGRMVQTERRGSHGAGQSPAAESSIAAGHTVRPQMAHSPEVESEDEEGVDEEEREEVETGGEAQARESDKGEAQDPFSGAVINEDDSGPGTQAPAAENREDDHEAFKIFHYTSNSQAGPQDEVATPNAQSHIAQLVPNAQPLTGQLEMLHYHRNNWRQELATADATGDIEHLLVSPDTSIYRRGGEVHGATLRSGKEVHFMICDTIECIDCADGPDPDTNSLSIDQVNGEPFVHFKNTPFDADGGLVFEENNQVRVGRSTRPKETFQFPVLFKGRFGDILCTAAVCKVGLCEECQDVIHQNALIADPSESNVASGMTDPNTAYGVRGNEIEGVNGLGSINDNEIYGVDGVDGIGDNGFDGVARSDNLGADDDASAEFLNQDAFGDGGDGPSAFLSNAGVGYTAAAQALGEIDLAATGQGRTSGDQETNKRDHQEAFGRDDGDEETAREAKAMRK